MSGGTCGFGGVAAAGCEGLGRPWARRLAAPAKQEVFTSHKAQYAQGRGGKEATPGWGAVRAWSRVRRRLAGPALPTELSNR